MDTRFKLQHKAVAEFIIKPFPFCVQATSCDGSWVHRQHGHNEVIIALHLCVSIAIKEEEIVDIDVRP